MRTVTKMFASVVMLLGLIAGVRAQSPGIESADFVLRGGKIATLDARGTIASAIAIRNARIVFVGNDAGVQPYIGPKTTVRSAEGRLVIPGLNETHVHAIGVAQGEVLQAFRQLRSIEEIQTWVREEAARTPAGEWIRLPRVDITRVLERRMPTRSELDAATDRPAIFIWAYANRQVQVLNSAALREAGIQRDTPEPKIGRIVRNELGDPTGVIEDAPSLTAKWLPRKPADPEQVLAALENVLRHYNRLGITSVTERGSNVDGWKTYLKLREQKRLPVRATLTIRVGSDGSVEGTERFIQSLPFRFGDGDEWVKVGPLKIGVDGGVLYGTAFLREPYGRPALDLYGLKDESYRGLLQMDAQKVENVIRTGHRMGWQMCSHVTGDAGVDMVLDAVERANADAPIQDRRFTLIHAYFPNSDTAERAARLGVCVDTQPAWYFKDGDALASALGQARMERFIGVQDWLRAGVKVVLNSDHMQGLDPNLSLNPYHPFLTLYTAVTRKTESGAVIGPRQQVPRDVALRLMTSDAAHMHFDEPHRGTLEVGKLGDLAVLSDDYFTCDSEKIRDIESVLTVVGGEVVYAAEKK